MLLMAVTICGHSTKSARDREGGCGLRRRADGLGIGLFVVRRIVDLLGHVIEVRSKIGRGSRFAVRARTTPAVEHPLPCLIRLASANYRAARSQSEPSWN